MKIYAVIHYSDGCQGFFKTREAALDYIKRAHNWLGESADYDLYISEGILND